MKFVFLKIHREGLINVFTNFRVLFSLFNIIDSLFPHHKLCRSIREVRFHKVVGEPLCYFVLFLKLLRHVALPWTYTYTTVLHRKYIATLTYIIFYNFLLSFFSQPLLPPSLSIVFI